jgi:FGFR1 oncogene partner
MEEMKELIIQSLETKGVLGQIRAHLRSAVFKVVDEQDQQFNTGCGLKWENKTLYKILETKIGTLLAEIIREFMEYFRMDYSLSIFIPECGISPERLNRKEILGKIGIMSNPQNDKFTAGLHLPLLYYIINYFISELKENPNKVIESIKKSQNDLETKTDEIIENNLAEFAKNQKVEEENIPLSNNSRDINMNNANNINSSNNSNQNQNQGQNNQNVNQNKEKEKEPPQIQKNDSNNNKSGAGKEVKKEKEEKPEVKKNIPEKKEEKKDEKDENKNDKNKGSKNEVQSIEDIGEEIDVEEIDDDINKNSGNYNSSQTVSVSQGYDNTVDSHQLENYNYIEQNEKK